MSGSHLFVDNYDSGTIGEYTTSGATVNASLVQLGAQASPQAIAVSGSHLFIGYYANNTGTVGEWTTSGATVNASLITNLAEVSGLAHDESAFLQVNGHI